MRSFVLTLALGLVFLVGATSAKAVARSAAAPAGVGCALAAAPASALTEAAIAADGPLGTGGVSCSTDAPDADGDEDPSGSDHEAPIAAPASTGPRLTAPGAQHVSHRAQATEPAHASALSPALQPPRG